MLRRVFGSAASQSDGRAAVGASHRHDLCGQEAEAGDPRSDAAASCSSGSDRLGLWWRPPHHGPAARSQPPGPQVPGPARQSRPHGDIQRPGRSALLGPAVTMRMRSLKRHPTPSPCVSPRCTDGGPEKVGHNPNVVKTLLAADGGPLLPRSAITQRARIEPATAQHNPPTGAMWASTGYPGRCLARWLACPPSPLEADREAEATAS